MTAVSRAHFRNKLLTNAFARRKSSLIQPSGAAGIRCVTSLPIVDRITQLAAVRLCAGSRFV
jgi:hypothetical protein